MTYFQELSLQPTRVTSIIYDAPIIRPSCARLIDIGQLYGQSLECLAFYHIPKYPIHRSYMDRVDTFLVCFFSTVKVIFFLILSIQPPSKKK